MKVFVKIVKDFDNSYYANMIVDKKRITNLKEHVNYNTLKEDIRNKTGFCILMCKDLIWQKYGRKKYAYIQNYKNDNVPNNASVDCRMIYKNGLFEHYSMLNINN